MIYEGKELKTIGDIFNKALEIAKSKNKKRADEFFNEYAKYILEDAEDIHTIEEAQNRIISNFGYFAGYYGDDVRRLMNKYYGAVHPIFGNYYNVTSEEAYNCGYYNKKLVR